MNIGELIAKLLTGQEVSNQNRAEAGISVLPQMGGIQQVGQLTDIRRRMMEAMAAGNYDEAAMLQDMMVKMQMPQQQQPMAQAGMF